MFRMKRLVLVLLTVVLCAAQIPGIGMANSANVNVFDFANVYNKPTTQSTLHTAELLALTCTPNDVYETDCAAYTLKQYAYDGCSVYMMVEVAPKSANVLLMSDYMYEPEDTRPLEDSDLSETFEQKAARDGQRIIVSGIGVDVTNPELAYFGSDASEKYFSDGTMLLGLQFAFKENRTDAPRSIDIKIREYEYGADWEEQIWPVVITPTTHAAEARAQLDQPVADGLMTAESVALLRSEIGAVLYINCRIAEEASAADRERIDSIGVEAQFGDDTIDSICSCVWCLNAQGEPIYAEQATGSDRVIICMKLGAGTKPAESVSILFHDYSADEDMSGFWAELVYESLI